jgi:YD repeat-containing protein
LATEDQVRQTRTLVTCTENTATNAIDLEHDYRIPLLSESRTYELTGLPPATDARFDFDFIKSCIASASALPYEATPSAGTQKRLIEHVRVLYRCDDLAGPLPLQQLEARALPFEVYKLVLTPGLLSQAYGAKVTASMLQDECGYVHSLDDTGWWTPSGQIFYSAQKADTPAQELAEARAHFFLSRRFKDPFGQVTVVDYEHDLLPGRIEDPLQNVFIASNDCRVLQARLVTDPNGSQEVVTFDALGLVAARAVLGHSGEGDSLTGMDADLDETVLLAHIQNPTAEPHAVLQSASTRFLYDLFAYQRTMNDAQPSPTVACAVMREKHMADLAPEEQGKVQHAFSYSDGLGREVQKKVQAEPGPLEDGGVDQNPRWIGSGWTIFNNKGKPVRKYEPFFTATHHFEFAKTAGVSPVLFYDPLERVIGVVHPNHAWEKVAFDPWEQQIWDLNDTTLIDHPKLQADVGPFFDRLPEADYLPTWHAQRTGGGLGAQELDAATKAAAHAGTPTVVYFDSLGRPFLTAADNGAAGKYATRVNLDIEGNQREVTDAHDRIVMRYAYDMLGNRLHQASMEAGERWMLSDVTGKLVRAWNTRDQEFMTIYDSLRRPIELYARENVGPALLVERTVYGESQVDPEATYLRGRVFQVFDQAGSVTNDEYDFKGNLLRSHRQCALEYKVMLDWSSAMQPTLDPAIHTSRNHYDALNRLTKLTTPDSSVIRLGYNEANLLNRVEVNLRGAQQNGNPIWTPFITEIDYNARGQRELIEYGNGARSTFTYDPLTFRLSHLLTQRDATTFPGDCPATAAG